MRAKKFGTLAGVYTPSVLTILGVIMYMRLGWVVGQAGLYGAITVILIAHIISVTTGLSISSIATDKKIKTGGIYYILSRSLGLPIGGSIGITLFIGTAMSISLYIIGFCENFLGVEAIRNFLGLGTTINDFRILGTAMVIFLIIIAFISTSVALKTQFFILAAIFLSLASIVAGFLIDSTYHPSEPVFSKAPTGISLEVIFAVFFPAVTGFTAGVAMSGDLKDSKKSIPRGTLLSIGTGLVVYLTLAVLFAFFVNRNLLLNDYNFLVYVAWFSPLVLAGIWGATLSSALGGILGAPRILQAISTDRITPKIFGKGFGKNNEPRNALLLTFFIAEIGIMIGELNIIARVVSMFYIAAYGFINISFALEKWASTDFRPTFRISQWVGIIGFFACFIVMLRLDLIAMFIAMIVLAFIYFFIKRKRLELDFGDVWQSVWSTVIRSTLKKMDKKVLKERNWHPNIILFSGGTKARPYLVDLGKALIGRQGFLSNFDLIENPSKEVLITKKRQTDFSDETDTYHGIFARRQEVDNIYDGIENIASSYGFSGVEPNTIMLGWGPNTKNPESFVNLIKRLSDLDFNILLVDYDKERKFGNKKKIDIWVRGGGNNGGFVLTLMRFIWLAEEWRNAKVRLLTVNPINSEQLKLMKALNALLDEYRIPGDIKIINNEIEQRPVYEIIQSESMKTDLVFLGMPQVNEGFENEFIANTNILCDKLGTVVLVKASSYFKELDVNAPQFKDEGSDTNVLFKDTRFGALKHSTEDKLTRGKESKVTYPENSILSKTVSDLHNNLKEFISSSSDNYLSKFFDLQKLTLSQIKDTTDQVLSKINIKIENNLLTDKKVSLLRYERNLLGQLIKIFSEIKNTVFVSQQQYIERFINDYLNKLEEIQESLPEKLVIKPIIPGSKQKKQKIFKAKKRIGEPLKCLLIHQMQDFFEKFGLRCLERMVHFKNLNKLITSTFVSLEKELKIEKPDMDFITDKTNAVKSYIEKLQQISIKFEDEFSQLLIEQLNLSVSKLSALINKNKAYDDPGTHKSSASSCLKRLNQVPAFWLRNQILTNNTGLLQLIIYSFNVKIREVIEESAERSKKLITTTYLRNLKEELHYLEEFENQFKKDQSQQFDFNKILSKPEEFLESIMDINKHISKVVRSLSESFPERMELFHEDDYNEFANVQFQPVRKNIISAARLIDFIIQSELSEPLENLFESIPARISESYGKAQQAMKSVAFNLSDDENEKEITESYKMEILNILSTGKGKVKKEITNTEKLIEDTRNELFEKLYTILNKVNYVTFTSAGETFKQSVRQFEKTQKEKHKSRKWNTFRKKLSYFFDHFYYQQSKRILARNILKTETKGDKSFGITHALNLVDSLSASAKIFNSIPFYYRQLFLRKQYYINEFWVGRESELQKFELICSRFDKGRGGLVVVTGDHHSGKSYFVNYAIKKFLHDYRYIEVNRIPSADPDIETFRAEMQKALQTFDSLDKRLKNIQRKTVILIDDLELWWRRSEKGLKIIEEIASLSDISSSNVLFVVCINKYAFDIIGKFNAFGRKAIGIVKMSNMKPEQLREAVMKRHHSGNYHLMIDQSMDDYIPSWKYAKLFSRLYALNNGIPGCAFYSWIANVKEYKNSTIEISFPELPDAYVLNNLPSNLMIILIQVILHKRIRSEELSEIMGKEHDTMLSEIYILIRSALLSRSIEGKLEINIAIYPYLISLLKQKEML